jgi:hypothetical protein
MTTPTVTHASLTILTAKRDELSKAIQAIEALLAVADGTDFIESAIDSILKKSLGSISTPKSETLLDANTNEQVEPIRSDAYFGMSVMDAVVAYLSHVKKPQTAHELIDAIKAGGYLFLTNNPLGSVTSTLNRSHQTNGAVVRTGKNTYALAEWYPSRARVKRRNLHQLDEPREDTSQTASEAEPDFDNADGLV